METKEKRNTGVVLVIILLVVALLGSVSYIVYDKVLNKNKTITIKKDSDNKEQEKTKKIGKITYKEAIDFVNVTLESDQRKLMSIVKLEDTDITDVKKYVNNLENQTKLVYPYGKESFTAEELKENIKKVWGIDVNYTDENIKCICGMDSFIYDSNTKIYNINQEHGGHDGDGDYNAYIWVIDFEDNDNNYSLLVKKAFYFEGMDIPTNAIYKSKDDEINKIEPIYQFIESDLVNYNSNTKMIDTILKKEPELLDKLNTYKYTFTKQNGKISLISYELIK